MDEFWIHISPILLGSGIRLFDNIRKDIFYIQIDEVIQSKLTTHIKYKLIKDRTMNLFQEDCQIGSGQPDLSNGGCLFASLWQACSFEVIVNEKRYI